MTERIVRLTDLTLNGEMYVTPVKTEFDREDLFLSENERDVKRLCEYIMNQEPKIAEYQTMTGFFNFDGSVVGDAFRRGGHRNTQRLFGDFYLKHIDNLSVCEWQHATADYKTVLEKGINGMIDDIDRSLEVHDKAEEVEFLEGLKKVAKTLIGYAEKCSERVKTFAEGVTNPEYKANLEKLSETLLIVPANPPSNFYEAVLTIYFCFSADPDSVGTLDRYLEPFYRKDTQNGNITREKATEYLQELFLMLQAATPISNRYFSRGGESHFCIGGYLPDGSVAFTDFSKLIVESLMVLPTYIPQITFRWTNKNSREDLRFMMNAERNDPHKRIAFTNDEKRIKCYTEICGIPYEKAVSYTTVGCNEPAFVGAITGSTSKINFAKSMADIFHEKFRLIKNAKTFDEFFTAYWKLTTEYLDIGYEYDNKYNSIRALDINYISSLFFNGCIENGKSLTQGGGNTVIASPMLMGIVNVIDALAVVKQFVYDEKIITLEELKEALEANWEGYEDLRTVILKKGKFFGNDDETSNYTAKIVYNSLYDYLKNKTNIFGYHFLVGDLMGYNEHHAWFGGKTKSTPDGRKNYEKLKFGITQTDGKDRNGLTALLNSIAKADENAIACGSTVTNITIDEQLIKKDENFEKTVSMFEAYFKNGGTHFQLTYVSKEDLINAKENPEKYGHLRVRVSGFSDYFVKLKECIQDDVIERTSHSK